MGVLVPPKSALAAALFWQERRWPLNNDNVRFRAPVPVGLRKYMIETSRVLNRHPSFLAAGTREGSRGGGGGSRDGGYSLTENQ